MTTPRSAPPPPTRPGSTDGRGLVVLQVLPHAGAGGVAEEALQIAAALAADGATALVASAGGPRAQEMEAAGARHIRLPLDSKNPARLWRNARALADLAAAWDADIVHARSRAPAWSAEAAARRLGRRFVTTFHGTYGHRGRLKRAYNAVMTRGDRVIAISEHIARHLRAVYATPAERIRLIHRGIDTARFDPAGVTPERRRRLRRAWDFDDGPAIVLPGRVTHWKGHAVLIEALARLGRADVRCALVGDDQGRRRYRSDLEALIARLGLAAQVRLVGPCTDMPAAYAAADLVVAPSTEPEAFGRVTAEAQAMARPVIAADHGGGRETVRHGETGWLAPPGDSEALADALARALAARERWPEIGAAGRARVLSRYTAEAMCRETLALYEQLVR